MLSCITSNALQLFTNFKLLVVISISKLYHIIICISVVNWERVFTESGISDSPILLFCHVKHIYPSLANVLHLEWSTFKYHLKLSIFTVTKKIPIHTVITNYRLQVVLHDMCNTQFALICPNPKPQYIYIYILKRYPFPFLIQWLHFYKNRIS